MPKPQDIFQLARQEAVRVTASPQVWQSFLYTAAHNYHTTYLNQLLIHAQRPDAAACASMEYWNKQANRLVMRGSKSIAVLQRRQGVAVAKPVFAIGDTTLLSQTSTGGPWEVTDTTRPLLLQGKSDDWLTALAQDGVSNDADRARRMLERNVADSTLQWAQPDEQMSLLQELATLCYRELHGIAVNFLKNYMAVALQGAVLYLVIGFYPALTASLGSGGDITEQAWAMLGKSVILLVAVFMSGRFTKAITSAI